MWFFFESTAVVVNWLVDSLQAAFVLRSTWTEPLLLSPFKRLRIFWCCGQLIQQQIALLYVMCGRARFVFYTYQSVVFSLPREPIMMFIIASYEYPVLCSLYPVLYSLFFIRFSFFESKKGFSTPTVCFLQDVIRGLPAPRDLNVKRRNGWPVLRAPRCHLMASALWSVSYTHLTLPTTPYV